MALDEFLRPVGTDARSRQTINEREQDVLTHAVQDYRGLQRLEPGELADLVVDIAKSVGRAPWCVGATPCVLPNSRLHWHRHQRVLGAREMAALQGVWTRDFRPSSLGASQRSGRGC